MDTLKYPTPQALMEDTCNAIREKDGTSEKIDHQDVPDRIRAIPSGGSDIDLSGITAQRGDVSERVQFMDSSGKLDYGSMPEIADDTVILDGDTPEHGIPGGHHTGGGKVKIVPDLSNIFTPTKEQQEFSPADGTVFTKIILDPIPDIYVDKTGANASTSEVLEGAKFIGAAGTVEEGSIHKVTGALTPITTNGTKYFMRGKYYDDTASIYVNVPQEIVSIEGEDSSGTSAVAADIRKGKTARSQGSLVTGTMPDVDLPDILIENEYGYVNDVYCRIMTSKAETSGAGYLAAGKKKEATVNIPVYEGSLAITPNDKQQYFQTASKFCQYNLTVQPVPVYTGSYEITPGDRQELPTSGLLMTENLVVKAVESNGKEYYLVSGTVSVGETRIIEIPLGKITNPTFVSIYKDDNSVSDDDTFILCSIHIDYTDSLAGKAHLVFCTNRGDYIISDTCNAAASGGKYYIEPLSDYFYGTYRYAITGT